MHSIHRPIPQPKPEYPGLTPAVRGQWQSIGNAGMVCFAVAWALCWYTGEEQGRSYALIVGIGGLCALLAEFYGRLRYRKKQLPFPRGYSLCRYAGFAFAAVGTLVQWQNGQTPVALPLLCFGLALFWASLMMDKFQRRRWREQRELEET